VAIISARNMNTAYIANGLSMAADFESDTADFLEMPIGCVQAWWSGNDAEDGTLELFASADGVHFASVVDSASDLVTPKKTKLWNLGVIGYQFVKVEYKAGSVSSGSIWIIAKGKISR